MTTPFWSSKILYIFSSSHTWTNFYSIGLSSIVFMGYRSHPTYWERSCWRPYTNHSAICFFSTTYILYQNLYALNSSNFTIWLANARHRILFRNLCFFLPIALCQPREISNVLGRRGRQSYKSYRAFSNQYGPSTTLYATEHKMDFVGMWLRPKKESWNFLKSLKPCCE